MRLRRRRNEDTQRQGGRGSGQTDDAATMLGNGLARSVQQQSGLARVACIGADDDFNRALHFGHHNRRANRRGRKHKAG